MEGMIGIVYDLDIIIIYYLLFSFIYGFVGCVGLDVCLWVMSIQYE